MSSARAALLHLLFLLSGVASLIYQVAWVRSFSLVFGGSVHSASLVTATVLAGLGLGGWWGGRWADRHPHQVGRAWALAEFGIGGWGVLVALVIPWLVPLTVAWNGYELDPAGWWVLSTSTLVGRAVVVAALLLPATILMGATLPLLARLTVPRAEEASWRIAVLYATSTLGAAGGAVLTDVVLLPSFGLRGAQGCAVFCSLLLATVVWFDRREFSSGSLPGEGLAVGLPWKVAAAAFLAGLAAMGVEMVWFRFLAGVLGPYRAVFSLLLATVLVGQAIGAAFAGILQRRWDRAALWFVGAQVWVVCLTLACLWGHDPQQLVVMQRGIAGSYAEAGPWARVWWLLGVNGWTIGAVVWLPSIAMGAAFPLLNALVQDEDRSVAARAGLLYLATTMGNVCGALSAGFWLLPGIGLQASAACYSTLALLSAAFVLPVRRWWVGVPGVVALCLWFTLPRHALLWSTFPSGRLDPADVLELREGVEQIVVVTGHEEGPARLWTSGHPMTSTTAHAQRYMRAMAHVPLLLRASPRRVLVICVGAGNTVHAATLHPSIETVEAVDLSADVLSVIDRFEHAHHGVLRNERVQTFVDDGRHHLWVQPPDRYDLITLEPPPLAAAGVSSLYAAEFYGLAKSRLTRDGVLSQWLPAYQVDAAAVRSIVGTFVHAFRHTVLLVGSGRELLLLGSEAPLVLDPTSHRARLLERPAVADDLMRSGLADVRELQLMFAGADATLRAATAGAPRITDDRPLLESAGMSHLVDTRLPSDLFDVDAVDAWCPACGPNPGLAVTDAVFASEAFLSYASARGDRTSQVLAPDTTDATLEAISASSTLTRAVWAPDDLALRAVALWDSGEREAARRHLAAARSQQPGVPLFDTLDAQWSAQP